MGNCILVSPNNSHRVELLYEGEPPHGDSYHRGAIDGRPFPGLLWGGQFGFSTCSRYFVFSWMPKPFERQTVVVDLIEHAYFALPEYIYYFKVCWPSIIGEEEHSAGKQYTFGGNETWLAY
jgi:hypothetical protein